MTERPNISALQGYAASEEGQKLVSVSKHGNVEHPDEGTYENKTDRDVILTYLTNIRKSGEVKVYYRYDVVGNMLIKEGLIKGARVYPYSDSFSYPFSVTQLPQHIRNLALSENHFSNDDEAAFHRIVQMEQRYALTCCATVLMRVMQQPWVNHVHTRRSVF